MQPMQNMYGNAHIRKKRRLSAESSEEETQKHQQVALETLAPSRVKTSKSAAAAAPAQTEVHNGKVVDASSSFATLGVASWLLVNLAGMEIRRPTAIQSACIPELLAGRDVIGVSRTGTGKTVSFVVPILQRLVVEPSSIYALVLTPTRELAHQIYEQFFAIAGLYHIRLALVTGGQEHLNQALDLSRYPHVVIATPGRLADHITYSGGDTFGGLRRVQVLVLDEADRLLDEGANMVDDIQKCLSVLRPSAELQTCLFTATSTKEVVALREKPREKGRPPISVCEVDDDSTFVVPPKLHQTYMLVPATQREAYLHVILSTPRSSEQKSIIIFCNRKSTADYLERLLRRLEHGVVSLHSKLSQNDRNSNLSSFRANAAQILVATDVASRGLDIPQVGLVINYDIPLNPDDYVHRVGRTARAGRGGESLTMVSVEEDVRRLKAIEERTGQEMDVYGEEGVNVEKRVAAEALKPVAESKVKARIDIDQDRDVKGNRRRGKVRRLEG